jgi:hypothetical protein
VKILELPERAQQLIGEGVINSAAIDQLRAIGTVAPNLLDAVIAYPDDGNAWAGRAPDPRARIGPRRRADPLRQRQGVRRLPEQNARLPG